MKTKFSLHSSCSKSILVFHGHDDPSLQLLGSYVPAQSLRNGAERSYAVSFQRHLVKHHVRGIHEGYTFYKGGEKKIVVNAASGQPLESESGASASKSTGKLAVNAIDAFYRFSRPHTVIGTVKFNFDK